MSRLTFEMTPHKMNALLTEFLRNLIETKCQAGEDFSGEQREWHLPRLNKCFAIACQLFPNQMIDAMREARTPYGDLVAGE